MKLKRQDELGLSLGKIGLGCDTNDTTHVVIWLDAADADVVLGNAVDFDGPGPLSDVEALEAAATRLPEVISALKGLHQLARRAEGTA